LLFTFIFIVIPEKLRWGESSACFLGIYNDSVSIKLYVGEGGLEFSSLSCVPVSLSLTPDCAVSIKRGVIVRVVGNVPQ